MTDTPHSRSDELPTIDWLIDQIAPNNGSSPLIEFNKKRLRTLITQEASRLAAEVIGEDDIKKPNNGDYDEWTVCDTCDVILSDDTQPEGACICDRRNELRVEQRQRLLTLTKGQDE